jgi:hypothetical protein
VAAAAAPSAMVCRDADDTRRRLPDRRRDSPSPAAAATMCSELRAPDDGAPAGVLPCAASPPPIAHSANATVLSAPRSTCGECFPSRQGNVQTVQGWVVHSASHLQAREVEVGREGSHPSGR